MAGVNFKFVGKGHRINNINCFINDLTINSTKFTIPLVKK